MNPCCKISSKRFNTKTQRTQSDFEKFLALLASLRFNIYFILSDSYLYAEQLSIVKGSALCMLNELPDKPFNVWRHFNQKKREKPRMYS